MTSLWVWSIVNIIKIRIRINADRVECLGQIENYTKKLSER